ncbi:unnamed protein product [Arabidopsis thaliana]|uniref:Galacturonosyltransferase n=6 Tax=Arabidopsis TaxID=3701 RepID=F4HTT8_ARATH|nr:galacturonosyltransferase [Arabidopsis thaliana]KAG7651643.1 hypothetical protein ISN45_At01g064880 [Arabidopsis thaliana x Arabidopsis arenosa]KAG7659510.1 hypothetical protein ISN44_As01g063780 [Arabidopsis suecica]AEE35548.1 galacturonosyltransferase [Arabidopsis thaliana]CAA0333969.1 unnamed protein product [Arabidopsis thaliana]CAD5317162.1 unnamed protein product [Arabidopsis thaliana]|eukprot:NP_001185396.1 galacturonosyltransferase [Arabidopsis thaliana]
MTVQISLRRQQALPRTPDNLYSSRNHYNLATTMMTMKSHIKNLTVQTTLFGQSVAKAIPKTLECSVVELTSNWLTEPSLQELVDENINSTRPVDNNLGK